VIGGIKLDKGEGDLAIIASLLSSYRGMCISDEVVFVGEVGLTGEVRSLPKIDARIKEIELINIKKVIMSKDITRERTKKGSLEIIGIETARELESHIFEK
jgi:DNA repair protein RadA/Sms